MPQVPSSENNAPLFNPSVPGVQFPYRGEFTRVGQAAKELGGAIEHVGATGAQIAQEIQRQSDIAKAAQVHAQASVDDNQEVENLKQNSPDGFVYDAQTKEPVQNEDGTHKTIAQQYQENATQRLESQRQNLTSGAANMLELQRLPDIANNTKHLQLAALELQSKDAGTKVQNVKDTFSKDFDRGYLPSYNFQGSGGFYSGPEGDDKDYPSAQKFFDAVQGTQALRQQLEPKINTIGSNGGPVGVETLHRADGEELAHNWLTAADNDMTSSGGSRAALHQAKKDGGSTALMMRGQALLAMVRGQDPESQDRSAKGLPTLNSSLSPKGVEFWEKKLLDGMTVSQSVDKNEYEMQKEHLGLFAKNVRTIDQFYMSDNLRQTLQAGAALNPFELAKDIAPKAADAVMAAATAQIGGLRPEADLRRSVNNVLFQGNQHWQDLLKGLNLENINPNVNIKSLGTAIVSETSHEIAPILEARITKMHKDPVGYMGDIRLGPNGPDGKPQYNSPDMGRVKEIIDGSVVAPGDIFKNGLLGQAQAAANNGYAQMKLPRASVSALSDDQFKQQAKLITNANDSHTVSQYFQSLAQSGLTPAQQQKYRQDLVQKGGLPKTWTDALTSLTPTDAEANFTKLRAGPAPVPPGWGDAAMTTLRKNFSSQNAGLIAAVHLEFGINSDSAREQLEHYESAWMEAAKQAGGPERGMDINKASQFATDQNQALANRYGHTIKEHSLIGFIPLGSDRPVPISFGKDYTQAQKENIQRVLGQKQTEEELSKVRTFVAAPGQLPDTTQTGGVGVHSPSNIAAKRIAQTAGFWRRVGDEWHLQVMEHMPNNRDTGNLQDVYWDNHGVMSPYGVRENEALAGLPK